MDGGNSAVTWIPSEGAVSFISSLRVPGAACVGRRQRGWIGEKLHRREGIFTTYLECVVGLRRSKLAATSAPPRARVEAAHADSPLRRAVKTEELAGVIPRHSTWFLVYLTYEGSVIP
jgi:hypothetical protein